ncbi:hypothetical protein KP509_30G000900 [Ceratopteris richardii]|uniref:Uncharacterized protein n=1 Tax=Ceratopteris richardii TaxID=49495 RepID=A0A8T2R0J0_CERRI|nr:hypothetical protein KP509_30G000900 [Ceratopteris richardii]
MAPLPPYVYASVPLILVSLWHAICSSRSYARSPSLFYARTWHPLPRVRYGELVVEILALAAATAYYATVVCSLRRGSTSEILALQQLCMLIFFTGVFLITFISEATVALPLPQDAHFSLLGVAFAIECFVAVCSASDPNLSFQLESFRILAALAAFSSSICFLLAWRSSSFLLSITFSASLALQGTWLFQIGVSLYSDRFLPEGCHHLSTGYTQCDVEVAKQRAVTIMDLLLIIHAFVIIFVYVFVYALACRGIAHARRNSGYDPMDVNGDSDHLQMKPLSKVVID